MGGVRVGPVCLLLLATGVPLAGQSLELRLTQGEPAAPVVGAIVRLLDSGNRVVASVLSSEQGRALLRAPRDGSYRVRIDRIGFAVVWIDPLSLTSTEPVRRTVPLPEERVLLPPIEVRAKGRCGALREEGGATLVTVLWEEVTKALSANALTEESKTLPIVARAFQRDLDQRRRPLREWVYRASLIRGEPFVSLPPAELATRGFAETASDSFAFAAPDARLLLSNEFITTHCFRAAVGEDGLLGLEFEPEPGREVSDVKGTLWVDRVTEELRHLEFQYTGLKGLLNDRQLGGRLVFRRLASGEWIVGDWYIRMPRIETRVMNLADRQENVSRVAGYIDRGGRAEPATDGRGAITVSIVRGHVEDSTVGGGLANARVSVSGSMASVVTDSAGDFHLIAPIAGPRNILITHPKLGLLGEVSAREVVLSLGDTTEVAFGVPSVATIVRSVCHRHPAEAAGIAGIAWDTSSAPARGHRVSTSWRTTSGGAGNATALTDNQGLFVLCDLPPHQRLGLRLEEPGRRSILAVHEARLDPQELRWVDLESVGTWKTVAATETPSGLVVLAGLVRNDSTGAPLGGAIVAVEGTGRSAETDDQGRYRIDSLPSGRHVALYRAIGFRPQREWLALPAGDTLWLEPRLVPSSNPGFELPDVEVTATNVVRRDRRAFEERRQLGMGRFIEDDELRRSEHLRLGDLLQRVSNVFVARTGAGEAAFSERRVGNQGERCGMAVWLDGVQIYAPPAPPGMPNPNPALEPPPPPDLNIFLASGIGAVEVYRSAAETPIEYGGSAAACGTILLWSKTP